MAPKKAAMAAADSLPTEAPQAEEKQEKKMDAATVRKLSAHPSTAIMVRRAIKALDSRKGVSSQAIQSYIKQNYPSVNLVRLKGLVRKALKKGIENGTLVRPANATAATGATGRFRLPAKIKEPKENSKEPKAKSENVDPNVQKAPKAAKESKDEAKKKKPAAKKEPKEDDKSSEEPKPAKKSKNDEDVLSSKTAPAKKPKAAKKAAESEEQEPVKPKGKAKAVKENKGKPEKEKPAQKGKAAQSKAQAAKSDEVPTKAQGKRGKKGSE